MGNTKAASCLCRKEDYYQQDTGVCQACPNGADCSLQNGISLPQLVAVNGFWYVFLFRFIILKYSCTTSTDFSNSCFLFSFLCLRHCHIPLNHHTTTGVQDWADTCTESKEFTCAGEKFSFTLLPGGFQKVGFCQFFTISELIGFNWPCKFRWSYPSEFCVPNRIWPIQPHAYTYACRARNMWGSSFNTAVLRRSCEHRLPYPS